MREIGLMFQGPLVLKIGAGEKTQTRRPFRHQPPFSGYPLVQSSEKLAGQARRYWLWSRLPDGRLPMECPGQLSPVGDQGDQIWVRETFVEVPAYRRGDLRWSVWDGLPKQLHPTEDRAVYFKAGFDRSGSGRWRPSIHMPRWAARYVLRVLRSWVHRATDISEADARAEGFESRAAFLEWWGAQYDDPRGRKWCGAVQFELVKGGA